MVQDIWRFALLAYKYDSDSPLIKDAINTRLENPIDIGYISEFSNRVIIAFSGTKGKPESWISDFDTATTTLTEYGTVHEGFYKGWSEFEKPISDYIKNNVEPDKPIFCTGHSRGGALCTLCALHLSKKFKNQVSNIHFASPKAGKQDFRDMYEHSPIYTSRVVNGYDIVPEVPFYDMGFRAVGRLIHFPQPIWHKFFCRISDHYPENYKIAVELYKPNIS